MLLLLRSLLARGSCPAHDAVVNIIIVNLRAIFYNWERDVAQDVVDSVCQNLAVLLAHDRFGLHDDLLGGRPGLFLAFTWVLPKFPAHLLCPRLAVSLAFVSRASYINSLMMAQKI